MTVFRHKFLAGRQMDLIQRTRAVGSRLDLANDKYSLILAVLRCILERTHDRQVMTTWLCLSDLHTKRSNTSAFISHDRNHDQMLKLEELLSALGRSGLPRKVSPRLLSTGPSTLSHCHAFCHAGVNVSKTWRELSCSSSSDTARFQ